MDATDTISLRHDQAPEVIYGLYLSSSFFSFPIFFSTRSFIISSSGWRGMGASRMAWMTLLPDCRRAGQHLLPRNRRSFPCRRFPRSSTYSFSPPPASLSCFPYWLLSPASASTSHAPPSTESLLTTSAPASDGVDTASKWVGRVCSIWADLLNSDLRGIFPIGMDPTHFISKPNMGPTGSNPSQTISIFCQTHI